MIDIYQDKNEIKIYFPKSVSFDKVNNAVKALCYAPKFKTFKQIDVRKFWGIDFNQSLLKEKEISCSMFFDINKNNLSLIIDFIDKLAENLKLSVNNT